MRFSRGIVTAVLIPSLLLAPGTPALADDAALLSTTGLTDGQLISYQTLFHPVIADDVTAVWTMIDGHTRKYTGAIARSTGVQIMSLGVPTDTDFDVTVRAYDEAGNYSELSTPVHTDFISPTATVSPASNALVHGVTTITASDLPDDVAAVILRDGDTEISRATSAPWELSWDTAVAATDGRVTIDVVDRAGLDTAYSRYYEIDNAGPVVSFPNWRDSYVFSDGTHGLSRPSYQDQSGVDHVEWWVDGALVSTDRTGGFSYDWGAKSRTANLEFRGWDINGYASTQDFTVTVDADAPTVTSLTPASGALVRGATVKSRLTATDVSSVLSIVPRGTDNYELVSPTATAWFPAGGDGKLTMTWDVYDVFMHHAVVRRTVVVDNTKPKLTTTASRHGSKIKVTASASDRNGVAKVQLLVNGKVVATDTKAAYAFTVNAKKYGKKFTVKLRAYDRAGNVTTSKARTWRR
ncbi:Ig-like domain-containing protein [Actinoplanes sp. NPDC051851]|uniref:Ig-like domain-containing protein n=1 Tax=Actinoplanes sp. NPDC051851 TaxID=3154753 RepID=UPI00343134A0